MPKRGGYWPDCLGVVLIAAILVLIGFGSGYGIAQASPTPPVPNTISTSHYYDLEWYQNSTYFMGWASGANVAINTDAFGSFTIQPESISGTNYQLYVDTLTGSCLWLHTNNSIAELNCSRTRPGDQWASSTSGNPVVALMWNLYTKETDPNECGSTLAPVITGFAVQGSQVIMECPDGNISGTMYGPDQKWQWNPEG